MQHTDVSACIPAGETGTCRRRGGDRERGRGGRGRDLGAHIATVEEGIGGVRVVDGVALDGVVVQDTVGPSSIVREAQAGRVGVAEGVAGRVRGRQGVAVVADVHAGAPSRVRAGGRRRGRRRRRRWVLREACTREKGGHGRDVLEQHLDASLTCWDLQQGQEGLNRLVVGLSRKAHTSYRPVYLLSHRGVLV